MGAYRARDLVLPPNLVSLVRVPLAAVFPFTVEQPMLALSVLALAGVSDVVDGFLARSRDQATPTGAVVDPITDKLFVGVVVLTLLLEGRLPIWGVPLLAARDIGELPLVAWWGLSHHRRRGRAEHPRANFPGKLATVLQFACVMVALIAPRWVAPLLVATGAAGVLAAITYWRRELAR
jgi:CDP-diacylglycerol--glycerol-3-phosphate 3-phosphatidyltransferase/cardiolipin synthase